MRTITINELSTEVSILKNEILDMKKKIMDRDLYLTPKEKKDFLQSLKEYNKGIKFSLNDIKKERLSENV